MPHCPPQISRRLTWYRTRASAVRNRRLNAFKEENQPSTELRAETCAKAPVDVPRSAKPFLHFTASLGSVKRHLKYNLDCAYTNEFPVACEELDVSNPRTIPREVIRLIRGHNFDWKDFWDSNQEWSRLKLNLK